MSWETVVLSGVWALWATYSKEIQEVVLRKLGDKASSKAKALATSAWERVDWANSANKYREKLQEIYGTIRILGKPEPVSLEGIFTDVLILDKPSAYQRYNIQQLKAEPEQLDKKPRKNGVALVKNVTAERLFILGKPGAGKTTFLKYITIQAAKGEIDRIPIFVSLKEWADSDLELMEFLFKQYDICDFPDAALFVKHILRKGHAMVLFDGLDEVNQEGNQRARMINDIRDFSNKYFSTQCLITCRVAATEYTFDQFVYVEIADFTDRQVNTFVSKWFKGARKKKTLFTEAFNRTENKRLQELARTPLLLSLLCLSFDATLDIPPRRAEIYEEAVEALLKKWDTSRSIKRDDIYRGLSLGHRRHMFARIAARTFQDGDYFLPQKRLSKLIVDYLLQLPGIEENEEIDGDTVLKAIEAQHGIFIERAHQIYSFSHLTFQEYFTAKQIVADTKGRALRGLLTVENITDDRWREVITLTVSLLDNADDFFDIFIESLHTLASREPIINKLLQWAKERAEDFPESAPALRGYYCYLILSLILTPSFTRDYDSDISSTSSLSFTRDYSASQIIQICFTIAQKLDRTHSLSGNIAKDVKHNLTVAHKALKEDEHSPLGLIPSELLELNSDLSLHLTQAFFFALSITNLQDSVDTSRLENQLRAYFVELRKYAITLSIVDGRPSIGKSAGVPAEADKSRDLGVPVASAPTHTWTVFVEKLYSIIHRGTGYKAYFTPEQHHNLAIFFVATRLLVDCLGLAVVSNRTAIEERLLRPLVIKNDDIQ
jgi:hypothetical protein